jgi:hypothetical protein
MKKVRDFVNVHMLGKKEVPSVLLENLMLERLLRGFESHSRHVCLFAVLMCRLSFCWGLVYRPRRLADSVYSYESKIEARAQKWL